jgi:hypothetical protein
MKRECYPLRIDAFERDLRRTPNSGSADFKDHFPRGGDDGEQQTGDQARLFYEFRLEARIRRITFFGASMC